MKKLSKYLVVIVSIFLISCSSELKKEETTTVLSETTAKVDNKETIKETEETIDNLFYKDATSLGKIEVENIAKEIKKFYVDGNFEELAKLMQYPINFDEKEKDFTLRTGGTKINSEEEFIECTKNLKFSKESILDMENETCTNMWVQASTGGISFGNGHVWMRDINFDGVSMETNGTPTLKIFALSGLE